VGDSDAQVGGRGACVLLIDVPQYDVTAERLERSRRSPSVHSNPDHGRDSTRSLQCFGRQDKWFSGVVVTNGAGSPRSGIYGGYTDAEMQKVRVVEQRKAAYVGEYGCQIQLGFSSAEVKNARETAVVEDLSRILVAARPEWVYLHNPADKHDTHVGVTMRAIAALRAVRDRVKVKKVVGCEVWRDLDWLTDEDKQILPVSARSNIAASLVGVFDSQVSGGKRYDLATAGRRLAHATYYASHGTDQESALSFGMDLTPLVENPDLDVAEYVLGLVDRFRADVEKRVKSVG
jgi:LmbE family N-acetylglucosaminyl deacetylase